MIEQTREIVRSFNHTYKCNVLVEPEGIYAGYGITFEYKFRDFHDRCIRTDTGWTITFWVED